MKKDIDLMDSDIDELMSDWFDRDGETFIKISSKARSGWEATLKEGSAYSSYILETPEKLELLKRAYNLAEELLTVMEIPGKVKIKISKGDVSATDGKRLQVATIMFDDDSLTTGEQLDAFMGTAIHEGCHLLFSNFDIFRTTKMNPAVKIITNIIEDERIEQLLGQEKPGLARFLEKSKYYWFDSLYMEREGLKEPKEENLFEKLLNIFLRVMRYPTYLKESDILFFGHHLFTIKSIVKKLPKDTHGAYVQALAVFEVFKEFYKEMEEERERKKKEEEESSDEEEESSEGSSGSGKDEDDDDDFFGDDSPKTGKSKSKGGSKDSEDESPGSPSKEDVSEERSKTAFSSIEEDSKKMSEELDKKFGEGKSLDSKDISKSATDYKGDLIEGTLTIGKDPKTFFKVAKEDKAMYKASYDRIRRYIPAISKIISGHCREYKLIHKSMRSGVLDSTKLAEAYQGVPTVYIREGEVKTDKVTVCVLADESGSMGGTRITAARDTAVLINEAVGNLHNVELYMYGHTGDMLFSGATELTVYREKGVNNRYALGSMKAHSQNRDGIAIHETALRVRKHTSNPVLMFILSDGAPAANDYGGYSALEHVRKCVKKVEKMGFVVVQVCINHSYDPSKMFDHYVILEDMSKLAPELGKVIKKATLKAAKVHVT